MELPNSGHTACGQPHPRRVPGGERSQWWKTGKEGQRQGRVRVQAPGPGVWSGEQTGGRRWAGRMGPAGHTEDCGCHTEETLQGGDRISSEGQQGRVSGCARRGRAGSGKAAGGHGRAAARKRLRQECSPALPTWDAANLPSHTWQTCPRPPCKHSFLPGNTATQREVISMKMFM